MGKRLKSPNKINKAIILYTSLIFRDWDFFLKQILIIS